MKPADRHVQLQAYRHNSRVKHMENPINRRVESHSLYMNDMLDRLGVSPDDLQTRSDPEAIAHAKENCCGCCASKACGKWLESQAEQPPIGPSQIPVFCPNSDYLASLCKSDGN